MATPLADVKDLHEDTIVTLCPKCNSPMIKRNRRSDGQPFYGCSRYPNCNGIRPYTGNNGNGNNPSAQQPVTPQKKNLVWSEYQKAIFSFVKDGTGNAVVNAVAGSSKTTSLIEALNYTDSNIKVGFVAFNKHIAKELARRAPSHVHVSTLHSLGYSNIRKIFPNVQVDEYKNHKILDTVLQNAPSLEYLDAIKQNVSTVIRLIALLQSSLMEVSDTSLEWLEDHYGITVNGEMPYIHDAVKKVFELAIEDTYTVDYENMIYFCATGIVPCQKFDFLFCDEIQDFSPAQIQMVLRSIAENGRVVGVGDVWQSIYSFRSADSNAIPNLIKELNATVLSLPITYRCPKTTVQLVNKEFPDINFLAWENASEGVISTVSEAKMLFDVKPGDLVLCRTNAPLVEPCFTLIREGKKAVIRGRDIGKGLQSLIQKVCKKYKATAISDFIYYLALYANQEEQKLLASNKNAQAMTLRDQVETLEALADGCNTLNEINSRIDTVFSDDVQGIVFSSIHKAKGDEADRVYVLHPELMPHKMAVKDFQKEEEEHIRYVCYTRAKQELFFVR